MMMNRGRDADATVLNGSRISGKQKTNGARTESKLHIKGDQVIRSIGVTQ